MYDEELGGHTSMVDLSAKQFSFLFEWRNRGFDPSQRKAAALAAGYSPSVANNKAALVVPIRHLLIRAMRNAGLTTESYAGKLAQLLEAKKENDAPDNPVQLNALKLALDIEDVMPAKKVEVDQRIQQVNYSVSTLRVLEERTGERLIPEGRVVDGELVEDCSEITPL